MRMACMLLKKIIGELNDVSKKTVGNVINSCKKRQLSNFTQKFIDGQMSSDEDFKPIIYNIWNTSKRDLKTRPRMDSNALTPVIGSTVRVLFGC